MSGMSTESRGGWLFSLRVKLLAVLIPLMGIFLLVAMVGLSRFLQEFFHRRAEVETARLGQAVTSALRQSMLMGSEQSLSNNLADLEKTPGLRRIWIIDEKGRVAHATDRAVIGRVLDKTRDPICTVCHTAAVTPGARTFFTEDETGTPIIRYVNPIVNEKVCWGCHDSKVRLNGILLLEESTQVYQEAIGTIQHRLGATGGITLAVLVVMTFFVTTVLVERPVRRLMAGVRQAGAGDLTVRVPLRGRDELAELASSFNVMAGNLDRSLKDVRNKNTELSVVYSVVERLTKTINLRELKEISLRTLMDVLEADQSPASEQYDAAGVGRDPDPDPWRSPAASHRPDRGGQRGAARGVPARDRQPLGAGRTARSVGVARQASGGAPHPDPRQEVGALAGQAGTPLRPLGGKSDAPGGAG